MSCGEELIFLGMSKMRRVQKKHAPHYVEKLKEFRTTYESNSDECPPDIFERIGCFTLKQDYGFSLNEIACMTRSLSRSSFIASDVKIFIKS